MSIIETGRAPRSTDDCGCGCGGGCADGDPCPSDGPIGLERTRWFARMLVGPDDLMADQRYATAARRRHNRLLHGWGVVCGLRVRVGKLPTSLIVERGFALGPWGHDIVVDDEVPIDVLTEDMDGNARGPCGDVDPWCTPVRVARDPERPLYLAIRYASCDTRPVRVFGGACGCDEAECAHSRTRDSYVLKLLTELPPSHQDMRSPSLAELLRRPAECPPPCPPCPDEPWVVLADVMVQGDEVTDIDCRANRRQVITFANFFYTCANEDDYDKPRTHVPSRVPVLMERRPPDAEEVRGEPIMISARRPDRSWTLIPIDLTFDPGTPVHELVRRHPRTYTDPDTGDDYTLAEIITLAGIGPTEELSGPDALAARLEIVDLGRTRDLRVASSRLEHLLDVEGRERLERAGGQPDRVVDLPAHSLRAIEDESDAGKRLSKVSIGDLAVMDDATLAKAVTSRVPAARRERAIAAARTARTAAVQAARIAEAWRGEPR